MAVRRALDDAVVPPIPACRVARIVNEREPLLFWVRTGRAQVEVAGTLRALSAGEAIWIPAGIPHRIATETGTVAFPLFPGQADLPAALNAVVVLTIPPGWEDWLVFRFAHGLGYLRGSVPAGPGLLGLVAGSRTDPSLSVPGTAPPPLPRSAAALEVARTLLRTPGDPTDLTAFAIRLRTGERTIQRQFREETGMPFTRWRAAARVAAAATYLDAGRGVGWAGKHVGFLTAAGFTRAFREHTGRTPIDYARSRLGLPARAEHTLTDELVRLSPLAPLAPGTSIAAAPPIPASSTWARVNDFHVVVWVYRGTARVTIGERTWRLRRGDAMWLPAGVHNSIEIDAGALLLPLGARPGTSPSPRRRRASCTSRSTPRTGCCTPSLPTTLSSGRTATTSRPSSTACATPPRPALHERFARRAPTPCTGSSPPSATIPPLRRRCPSGPRSWGWSLPFCTSSSSARQDRPTRSGEPVCG